jgi:hypothetical protein
MRALLASVAICLLSALQLGAASPAAAQATVTIELVAPAGHPGATVESLTLFQAGGVVGEFTGTLAASGGRASNRVSVSAVPDAFEFEFKTPFGGDPTLYVVTPADFAFGVEYFLPVPSLGGTVGPQPGDLDVDAFVRLTLDPPPLDDTDAPTCDIQTDPSGSADIVVQDVDSGLAEIYVRTEYNFAIDVPAFAPGTIAPVVVTADVVRAGRTSIGLLQLRDAAGNRSYCKVVTGRTRRGRSFRWSSRR